VEGGEAENMSPKNFRRPLFLSLTFKRHFEQEKKAHENWVAARQAERKLNDLQVRYLFRDKRCNCICGPEMEFFDINLTKDSSLLFHAIHSPPHGGFLKKTRLCYGF
jgi:hypothetical protein